MVLIAEDEVMVRWPLAEHLRNTGYKVIETSNASDAMSVIVTGSAVDLVIADFKLPGGPTGYMLAHWLETNRPAVPLILISGLITQQPGFVSRAKRRFVAKPIGFAEIEQQIREMLADKN